MRMEQRLRRFFRSTLAFLAVVVAPWTWAVARKRPHYARGLRVAVALVAICAVLIVPMVMSASIHFTPPALECAAVGCGVAITVIGAAAVAALCAGLAGPAAVACAAVFAA